MRDTEALVMQDDQTTVLTKKLYIKKQVILFSDPLAKLYMKIFVGGSIPKPTQKQIFSEIHIGSSVLYKSSPTK